MKKSLLIVSVFLGFSFSTLLKSQIISTIAGNYSFGAGFSGDGGQATDAEINLPYDVATDTAGNLFIVDGRNNVIRKVNTLGIISTVAGIPGNSAFSGDGGPATAAGINYNFGIALDKYGNIYIAGGANVVRKINTSGIINTIAGNPAAFPGYSGDGGPATAAEFYEPFSLALDSSGNLYIADVHNNVVRKVDTAGIITTVVGNGFNAGRGMGGYFGDGGPATLAELASPDGLAFDKNGNLFVSDVGNAVIRMVNTSGIISTTVGNNAYGTGYSGDGGPATAAELVSPWRIAIDADNNLYFADAGNYVIRKVNTSGIINTVVGINTSGYSGDGGLATNAELNFPAGITFNKVGELFIADINNNIIRKVSGLTTVVKQFDTKPEFVLFPNPNNGYFMIQSSVVSGQWSVEIYNMFGMGVYFEKYRESGGSFKVSLNQPAGVYIYKIYNEDSGETLSGKIVIEK